MKGPRSTLTFGLIYSHCPIRLNISSDKMTLASTVFQISTFQKKSHLNVLGSHFDLEDE